VKVFDLCCSNAHRYEGWFASEDDFASQVERGLLECPLCGDATATRMPSAPRLNLAANATAAAPQPVTQSAQLQAAWLQAVRKLVESTEDVGTRFAEEARRIHYGETPQRGIRGQATPPETEALREEGIEVMPLPMPPALKGPLQ
jgi:hypothetical protein